ncbi:MAG TPA: methyltransferase domain-containing protein [Solirubrobacteraceae bacterium]|nr:methyltransferase domain-containing protein [Solirubrobacteraceae bacterium]
MVDWGAGHYERTATELDPVARAMVALAGLEPGVRVIDLACGTGNAALHAAAAGAWVIGIDSAPRLLEVARDRARARGLSVHFREGDLLDLPVADDAADLLLSVFGVIFAPDPGGALGEIARVVRPGGRVLLSAWVPAGPIDAMLTAMGTVLARVTNASAPARFAWFDPAALGPVAERAGLSLERTTEAELAITDSSPEAYVAAGQEHPMSLTNRRVLEQAEAAEEARAAMVGVLREANEDPDAFLVHSPYVVHELRVGGSPAHSGDGA